jgi:hypothetical protein
MVRTGGSAHNMFVYLIDHCGVKSIRTRGKDWGRSERDVTQAVSRYECCDRSVESGRSGREGGKRINEDANERNDLLLIPSELYVVVMQCTV